MENSSHSASCSSTTSTLTSITTNTFNAGSGSGSGTTTSTSTATTTAAGAHVQSSLKALNKASYKISKPVVLSRSSIPNPNPTPLPKAQPPALPSVSAGGGDSGSGAPPQPPVYNIDKNDFRDVVQKLTGSPAHHNTRPAAPSPAPPPTAAASSVATSRLHRIRPPPLSHLAPLPSSLVPPAPQPAAVAPVMDPWTRPPLSPLPPLPTVSAAAESPISAYMRGLRAGSGQPALATAAAAPLGFGCLPSPRITYQTSSGLVSPKSPGVQLPSPRLGNP